MKQRKKPNGRIPLMPSGGVCGFLTVNEPEAMDKFNNLKGATIMKYASDFRRIAREALSGKWVVAVIAGILASLLGAISSSGPELKINITGSGADVGVQMGNQTIVSWQNGLSPELSGLLAGGIAYILVIVIAFALVLFVLGSVVSVGYARFNLELHNQLDAPEIGTLFGFFGHWKTAAASKLLRTLYVLLWSLLLFIPGIMATYSYAMTDYILAENPELTASEAIARSKQMMMGNRFRLFCLELSFIGWGILAALTLGIGNLWLTPYRQAATAAFYQEVSGAADLPSEPFLPY